MNILLSIKPKWLEKIRNENKTFELRRVLPKGLKSGDVIYFYESSPVSAITAKCVVESVSSLKRGSQHIIGVDEVSKNLSAIKKLSKVSASELGDYFEGSKFLYQGFKIDEFKELENPVYLGFLGFKAPQNFCYLNDLDVSKIKLVEK